MWVGWGQGSLHRERGTWRSQRMKNSLLGCQGYKNILGKWRGSCESSGHDFRCQGVRESSKAREGLHSALLGLWTTWGQSSLLDKHALICPQEGQGSDMICLKEHSSTWQSYSPGSPEPQEHVLFPTFWFSRKPLTKIHLPGSGREILETVYLVLGKVHFSEVPCEHAKWTSEAVSYSEDRCQKHSHRVFFLLNC